MWGYKRNRVKVKPPDELEKFLYGIARLPGIHISRFYTCAEEEKYRAVFSITVENITNSSQTADELLILIGDKFTLLDTLIQHHKHLNGNKWCTIYGEISLSLAQYLGIIKLGFIEYKR